MKTDEYRIIQVDDERFGVEELDVVIRNERSPFGKRERVETWRPTAVYVEKIGDGFYPLPRRWPTQAEAQKWLDDHRKYPLVVKHPA